MRTLRRQRWLTQNELRFKVLEEKIEHARLHYHRLYAPHAPPPKPRTGVLGAGAPGRVIERGSSCHHLLPPDRIRGAGPAGMYRGSEQSIELLRGLGSLRVGVDQGVALGKQRLRLRVREPLVTSTLQTAAFYHRVPFRAGRRLE